MQASLTAHTGAGDVAKSYRVERLLLDQVEGGGMDSGVDCERPEAGTQEQGAGAGAQQMAECKGRR
jgi:hypothetical protein